VLSAWLLALLAACQAPEPSLLLADGARVTVPDAGGRWLVVNYFAEWCAPCRHEIPELNQLASAHAGRVSVLGVNFDAPPPAESAAQAARLGVAFPVLAADPTQVLAVELPGILPVTVLVAPDGARNVLVGPQTRATLEAAMQLASTP
jgi:thiol-disulfide isomerase/thioredoxin